MAITATKTWEYVVNLVESVGGGQQDRNERLMLALKSALTDTNGVQAVDASGANISLTSPWSVVASSDSVTADATDRWAVQADIVGAAAGVAHSWIHMRQVDYFGSGDHLHMLIDCIDLANMEVARVSYNRGAIGYNADGTNQDRPTLSGSTAELITRAGGVIGGSAITSSAMWGSDAAINQCVLHVRVSDDGLCGGWFVATGGAICNFHGWQIEEDGEALEPHPWHVWGAGFDSNAELNRWVSLWNDSQVIRTLDSGGLEVNPHVSQAHIDLIEAVISVHNLSATRFLHPAYIVDQGNNTIRGQLTDMWWGSTAESTGDGSPTTPPAVRRQVGDMVIPWPSGVVMTVT